MERYSRSSNKSSKGFLKHSNKFTPEKASKRKLKVSLFQNTNHSNKLHQMYLKRKRDIETDMDKVEFTIGELTFAFQNDGTWQETTPNKEPLTRDALKQKKSYEKLESENSKLRLSYEVLLNMVISKNSQIEKLESEVKKLQGIISKPSVLFPDSDSWDQ